MQLDGFPFFSSRKPPRKRSERSQSEARVRSPLSHIPMLRGTYASCYRQSYGKRSSFRNNLYGVT
jgi:hypothetical protein